jgi:hypothetical protein
MAFEPPCSAVCGVAVAGGPVETPAEGSPGKRLTWNSGGTSKVPYGSVSIHAASASGSSSRACARRHAKIMIGAVDDFQGRSRAERRDQRLY